jgi:hypothetical protein
MRRKVITSGKTGFIVGWDLDNWAEPKIVVMWSGEFLGEGQKPVELRVSA